VIRERAIRRKSTFSSEDLGPYENRLVTKRSEAKAVAPIRAERYGAVEEAGTIEAQAESSTRDPGGLEGLPDLNAGSLTQQAIGVLKKKNLALGLPRAAVHLRENAPRLHQYLVGPLAGQLTGPVSAASIDHDQLIDPRKLQAFEAFFDATLLVQGRYDCRDEGGFTHGLIVAAILPAQKRTPSGLSVKKPAREVFLTKQARKKLHLL
jgi:hypothetical protein